ncbi:MAG: hypothetical protein JNK56_07640, partial [Myxococcales bacterium]|nr:hypothetical protein [Myxococcales bacterium]
MQRPLLTLLLAHLLVACGGGGKTSDSAGSSTGTPGSTTDGPSTGTPSTGTPGTGSTDA